MTRKEIELILVALEKVTRRDFALLMDGVVVAILQGALNRPEDDLDYVAKRTVGQLCQRRDEIVNQLESDLEKVAAMERDDRSRLDS